MFTSGSVRWAAGLCIDIASVDVTEALPTFKKPKEVESPNIPD